jgi:5-formyltetrahydrofolate cyclo-ligase
MTETIRRAKRRLRREQLDRLANLSTVDRQREAVANCRMLLDELAAVGWPDLAAYAALPDECDTADLLAAYWERGRQVWLPRLLPGNALAWHAVAAPDQLVPGAYGIREPLAAVPGGALPRDGILVVPGLAFTAAGHRLGRGGGCYDRLLTERPAATVGFGFGCQLLPELPQEPHDARVERVLCGGRFADVGV